MNVSTREANDGPSMIEALGALDRFVETGDVDALLGSLPLRALPANTASRMLGELVADVVAAA